MDTKEFKITLDQYFSRTLRWLAQAKSKDDARPTLTKYGVDDQYIATTDGFSLHVCKNEQHIAPKLPGGVYDVKDVPLIKNEYGLDERQATDSGDCTFPDWQFIMPTGKPVFSIAVDPEHLIKSLRGLSLPVRLNFYHPTMPMEVLGNIETKHDEIPCYALIMPCHENGIEHWRPGETK